MMKKSTEFPILLCGYGNVDREDDGVAWQVLARLAERLGRAFPQAPEDFEFLPGQPVDFSFSLQLIPEMADLIHTYARVCFIDAHTGAYPQDIQVESLQPRSQASPFTHHLTPAMLLNLTHSIYRKTPSAILVSVRGTAFGFRQGLSPGTEALADQAADKIIKWINKSQ